MKKCIIPGSYDPVTAGHTALFRTAAEIFDEVYAVILVNSEKKSGMFSPEERLRILISAISALESEGYKNIHAILSDRLTTDAARELGAGYIVKGIRGSSDFGYEYDLSQITRRFDKTLKTVFIPCDSEMACVSSTYVRELIKYGQLDSTDLAEGTSEIIADIMGNKM